MSGINGVYFLLLKDAITSGFVLSLHSPLIADVMKYFTEYDMSIILLISFIGNTIAFTCNYLVGILLKEVIFILAKNNDDINIRYKVTSDFINKHFILVMLPGYTWLYSKFLMSVLGFFRVNVLVSITFVAILRTVSVFFL